MRARKNPSIHLSTFSLSWNVGPENGLRPVSVKDQRQHIHVNY